MLNLILRLLVSAFRTRQALILENAALRHQIEVLQRNTARPTLHWSDRAFWDVLSCIWTDWRRSLYIVQPETVVRWHKQGFRFYWRWKSRYRWPGRPKVSREVRGLIRQMSSGEPTLGRASHPWRAAEARDRFLHRPDSNFPSALCLPCLGQCQTTDHPFQRDRLTLCCVDRPADRRSLSLGNGAEICDHPE